MQQRPLLVNQMLVVTNPD